MRITIDIETLNSAFWNHCEDSENPSFEYSEVERILKEILPRIEYTDHGLIVIQTSDDQEVIDALHKHAIEVSDLAARGMVAVHEQMMSSHH